MDNLEKLKKIVLEGGFDEESRKEVAQLEESFQKLFMAEKLAQNPVIQEFLTYLKSQSENCTFLLSNKRELTDLERDKLFEKRDLCDKFINLFTGDKSQIENEINSLLTQAQNA